MKLLSIIPQNIHRFETVSLMKDILWQEDVQSLAKGHLQETMFLTQITKQKEDNFQT